MSREVTAVQIPRPAPPHRPPWTSRLSGAAVPHAAGDRGIALVAVIFALLALVALGHTALYLARQEWLIADLAARRTGARHAAEAGAAILAATWDARRYRPLALLETAPPEEGELGGGLHYRARVRRLGTELFLVESTGIEALNRASVTVGHLLWALEPAARLAAFPAAVTARSDVRLAGGAVVDATRATLPPPGWTGAPCQPFTASADSLYPSGRLAALAVAPDAAVLTEGGTALYGTPPMLPVEDAPPPALGPLSGAFLATRAERYVNATVTPGPITVAGTCDLSAPANWGAPSDPLGPCGAYFPLVAGTGAVTMDGGEGQGVLVVDGDLEIRSAAYFAGIVLVRGRLALRDNAVLVGFAVAGGGVELGAGARAEASACAALRALSTSEALQRAFRLPQGGWIPLY